jgi:predicted porin
MKNALLAALLLSTCVGAQAQSSVTLYGRIDAGIEYLTDVHDANGGQSSRISAESGNWGTSLLGLKGSEDIGGGNKVVFHLEGDFNTVNGDMGTPNTIWDRWATIGLSSPTYGTFLMGRELFITVGVWDFDPFGESSWSSASLVRGRNWPQSSNNLSYQSPKIDGFDFYGQYSLSNATSWNGNGTTSQGREDGAQITYTTPLFQIRGLYDEIRNPANGALDNVFQYSREYVVGVNVFLGQIKLQGAWENVHATSVSASAPSVLNHEWGGVTWQATAAAELIAAVYHVNANNGGGNATIYTIGGIYYLTNRTLLDFQAATVRNSSSATFGLEANLPNSGTSPLSGQSQSGVYAGIQHTF